MKKKDIKKQSKDELSKNIEKLKKDLFNISCLLYTSDAADE